MAATLVASVSRVPSSAELHHHAHQLAPGGPDDDNVDHAAAALSAGCLDPPCRVLSSLYIGSRDTEANFAALQAAGITHVLQCGVELAPSHPERFTYHQLSCSDSEDQDIVGLFGEAFAFIDRGRRQGAVLVHCAQGVSRSAALLAGYLMARQQQGQQALSYDAALARLRAARPRAAPNAGFVLQLHEFGGPGCRADPEAWGGWSAARAERRFAAQSISRRREVCGLADMIRRFHAADVGEEDTVFDVRDVLL